MITLVVGPLASPRRFIQKMLDGHMKGLANDERLFGLVIFELWRREYRIGLV